MTTLLSRASSLFSLLLRRPQLWVPDRRPIKGVGGFGGWYKPKWVDGPFDPEYGRRPENRGYDKPETARWFLGELDAAVNAGYRRILLDRLNGHPKDQRWVPLAQWWGGDDASRSALATLLTKWIGRNPGVDVYAYVGAMTSQRAYARNCFHLNRHAKPLDMGVWKAGDHLLACLEPWLGCGVRGFSFDASANPQALGPHFEIRKWLRERHPDLWVGGEALPVELIHQLPANVYKLLTKHIPACPWQVSSTFMRDRDPHHLWSFDPRRTEVNVSLEDREVTEEEVVSWHGRGCNFIDFTGGRFDSLIMQLKSGEVQ